MSSSAPPPPNSGGMKKIIIGVCAMERKANSKPMKAIMSRMCDYYKEWLEFLIFPEKVVLEEPVENWPLCDCLISFHSTDFPLRKAIEYERLRHPYTLNDLNRQFDLLDRRKVFRTLARAGIDHPRHCVLVRDEEGNLVGNDLNENNDHIEVNGMIFNKPFVEKPISAEDHNVYIYFPSSVGGGSQRLFRKVNDRSSWYSPVSTVRHTGSYIYEEFIPADGTDVKVYAVGPYYAHAEARKAPGLDGKVERDSDGKEIRYPVILSAREKMIARRVVLAFGQTVCGFDLLRANGRSFVCDVNGFSFVKTSTKYYEDTAKILGNMILRRLASCLSIPWHIPFQADDPPLVSTPSGKIMELRCVIAVIRHGDRTPKQKMKVIVSDERFYALFKKYDGTRRKEIKMKRPNQLMEVLDLIRVILAEQQALRQEFMQKLADFMSNRMDDDTQLKLLERELEKCEESVKTWDQMRTVLEMYGHFSGINRKVQLKYFKPKEPKSSSKSQPNLEQQQSLGGSTFSVLGATASAPNVAADEMPKLMLILKWGGELTTAGVLQAEALGKLFRTLYPGIRRTDGRDCPEDTQGLGFLRLHSTYRHDLKIYASDEGRVQMTAAAFAKGLLALEGELTPILMQMVKSANTDGLLNDDYSARQFQNELKSYLHSALQVDRDFSSDDYQNLNPSGLRSLTNAMEFIKNPRKMCHEIAGYVERMCDIIRWHKHQNFSSDKNRTLYLNETWELAERRWSKELREFRKINKSGDGAVDFDISKIPDIYDNIKYDMEHNPDLCINNEGEFERFYLCVKNMADIVVPQEYGISEESKICVAQRVCSPLMSKLRNDLHRCVQNPEEGEESLTRLDPRASEGIATPMRHVRTRLYFTSESHIHTLMNLIRYGGLCSPDDKKWQRAMNFLSGVTEFNYMTQVVLMVYEDSRNESDEKGATDRFHIELLFSPGLYPCFQTEKERIYESRFNSKKQQQQQQTNQQSSSKTSSENVKLKNLSGKSSSDASDKEFTEVDGSEIPVKNPIVSKSSKLNTLTCENLSSAAGNEGEKSSDESKRLQREKRPSPVQHHHHNVLHTSKTDLSEKASANYDNKFNKNAKVSSPNTSHVEEEEEDEEDELADHSVNLVVLGEVSGCKQFTSVFISATGDLARHSPPSLSPLRKRRPSFERSLLPGLIEGQKLASIGEVTSVRNKPLFRQGCDSVDESSTSAGNACDGTSVRLVIPHPIVSKHKTSGINTTITKSMSDVACNRRRISTESTEKINMFDLSLPKSELDDHQTTVGYGRGEWAKDIVANSKKMSTIDQSGERSEGESISSRSSTNGERISLASVFIRDDPTAETSTTADNSKSTEKSKQTKFERTDSNISEGLMLDVKKNCNSRPFAEHDHLSVRENDNPATASSSTIKDDESGNLAMSRRSRFPYRFKHHTVNLLSGGNGVENRLISTDVLMGKFADAAKRKPLNNSAVLSTAVIARSSSAPRLQTYKAGDVIPMAEIRRFWPPLRSLETMHDNIAFKELDIFLERMMKNSTPLPSPPKTPIHRDMSSDARASLDTQMKDTIKRLARMNS